MSDGAFKPNGDKITLTLVLLFFFWGLFLLNEYGVTFIRDLMFPLLSGNFPFQVTLSSDLMAHFETFEQQKFKASLILLPLKILLTTLASYIVACWLYNAFNVSQNQTDED